MNTNTTNRPASLIALRGKDAPARSNAFLRIAVDSFMADVSRVALVATLTAALGKAPTDAQIAIAKQEYVIGRVASRLPASELPRGTSENADKLEFARKLVLNYQTPTKAAAGAVPPLRKGMLGWRSALQHRTVRNAEESWSQVKADIGIGTAKTDRQKKADAKAPTGRAPAMAGSTARGKGGDKGKVTHLELVQRDAAPVDCVAFAGHIVGMLQSLGHYARKHAKVAPLEFSAVIAACNALHGDAKAADAKMHERLARAAVKAKPEPAKQAKRGKNA